MRFCDEAVDYRVFENGEGAELPTFLVLPWGKVGKRKASPRKGFLSPKGRRIWKKGKRFGDEAGGYRVYFQRRWVQSQQAGSRKMVRSMRRVYSSVIQFSGLERGASVRR